MTTSNSAHVAASTARPVALRADVPDVVGPSPAAAAAASGLGQWSEPEGHCHIRHHHHHVGLSSLDTAAGQHAVYNERHQSSARRGDDTAVEPLPDLVNVHRPPPAASAQPVSSVIYHGRPTCTIANHCRLQHAPPCPANIHPTMPTHYFARGTIR